MESDKEIIHFLKELHRVISKFGADKVLSQIRKLHLENDDEFVKQVANYILALTSTKYGLTKDELMYSKKRGSVIEARRMCFALMKEHLNITDEEIGGYFGGKTRQYINLELQNLPINKDEFNDKEEETFVNEFISISTDVLYFINSYDIKVKDNE